MATQKPFANMYVHTHTHLFAGVCVKSVAFVNWHSQGATKREGEGERGKRGTVAVAAVVMRKKASLRCQL